MKRKRKRKQIGKRIVALLLMATMCITMLPGMAVFAEETEIKQELTEQSELWQPSDEQEKLSCEGDLSLDELKTAELASSDTPEIVSEEDIKEKGHVNRLWEQEDDLNSIVFQNRDGTKTMYYYNYPVKYKDESGKIKDKSNKISQTADGDYTNAQNDINTYFPKKLNKNKGVELKFGEYNVELSPEINGNSGASRQTGHNKNFDQTEYVQYPDVFDKGIALRYTPTFEGYKEDIILNEYTEINEFTFRLRTDGLSMVSNNGSYFLSDPITGEIMAEIGELYVYDSKPYEVPEVNLNDVVINPKDETQLNEVLESVSEEKTEQENTEAKTYAHRYAVETVKQDSEYLITIVVDKEYLRDSERVWPVYVDPTISASGSGSSKTIQDAAIYNGRPTTAHGGTGYTYANAGYIGNGYGVGRVLMKFPGLSTNSTYKNLTADQITELELHIYEGSGSNNASCIGLYQFNGAQWDETTATCKNTGFGSVINNFTSKYINSSGWQTFDLTNMVEIWKNDSVALNKGIMLKNLSSESSYSYSKHFNTTESDTKPYLTFSYTPTYITLYLGSQVSNTMAQDAEHWYKFTPPQTDYYNIYTSGSTDTYCELYQGTSLFLEGDDDDGDGNNFKLTRKLSKDTTYYFKVRGYSSSTSGSYSLKIECDFVNQLQKLHDLAKAYASNNTEAVELTMQFIRRGKYTGNYMNLEFWGLAAGDVNSGFVSYVKSQNAELYEYFTITGERFLYRANGEKIDIPHLAATYNIYQFNTFGQIGSAVLPEYWIDNLGGWAGDLRSIIPYVMRNVDYTTDYDSIYDETMSQIGSASSKFSMPDLLADVDAYNLYNSVNVSSLATTFNNYYINGGTNTRFTSFTNEWTKTEIFNLTKEMMTNSVVNSSAVWPLKKVNASDQSTSEGLSLSNNQMNAICNAFTDYLWNRIQLE